MATYAIITENDESKYKDIKGVQYHFPVLYHKILVKGTFVIYYKGILKKEKYRSERLSSNAHYFGLARISNVSTDKEDPKLLFAEFVDFNQFDKAILSKNNDGTFIENNKKIPGYTFSKGVREIDESVFKQILSLAEIATKVLPELDKQDNENSILDLVELPDVDKLRISVSESNPLIFSRQQDKIEGKQRYYARNTKKTGDRGEAIALEYLKQTLTENESNTLDHLAARNITPGYDIEYTDSEKHKRCIEVKSTTAKNMLEFILTVNEWKAAMEQEFYEVCFITQCTSLNPQIYFLGNPYKLEQENKLKKEPLSYRLRPSTDLEH